MWWLVVAGVCSYSREYLQAFGLLNGTAGGATEFHGLFDWTVIDPLTNGTIAPPSPCQNPCVDPTDEVGVLHFPGAYGRSCVRKLTCWTVAVPSDTMRAAVMSLAALD